MMIQTLVMKFNSLIPELSVSNFSESLRFYVDVLGFKVEYDRPIEKFAFLSIENAQLMIEEHNGNWDTAALAQPYGRGINFQIEITNLNPVLERLRQAGIALFVQPRSDRYKVGDQERSQRQFLVQDPDGYLLRFCQELSLRLTVT
jgi:catechol 2,3-dioxygenase-like lactoylglutathione lyase family enzyme